MGCPGTGRPGVGRGLVADCWPACARGWDGAEGGAWYTGRGPVCGTIMRGLGAAGCAGAEGATGFAGADATGDGACTGGRATGICGLGAVGRLGSELTGGGGTGGRGDGCGVGVVAAAAECCVGVGGAATGGLTVAGVITLGAGGGVAGLGGAETGAFAAGAAGFTSGVGGWGTGGRTGGGATADCFWLIALRTSPGFEMWDRSILVLMPSTSVRAARADLEDAAD